MHPAWVVKHRHWLRKYWRSVSLTGGTIIAAIPVAVGLNQLYLAYIRPLMTHRLDGPWCVADVVRHSHHDDFIGMEMKFSLRLEQDSDGHLSGNGKKSLVNGALPPSIEISALTVQKGSSITGSEVHIVFVEGNDARPERRNLVGTFDWKIVDENTLVGTFDTAAAGSSGRFHGPAGKMLIEARAVAENGLYFGPGFKNPCCEKRRLMDAVTRQAGGQAKLDTPPIHSHVVRRSNGTTCGRACVQRQRCSSVWICDGFRKS